MNKEAIDEILLASEPEDLYPIWIISYSRAGKWPTYRSLKNYMDPDVRHATVHMVVRAEEVEAYRRDAPELNYHVIPDGYRGWEHSAGCARQAAMDFAVEQGHERIIMLDDDILHFRHLFKSEIFSGPNTGQEKSGHTLAADYVRDPIIVQHILTLFSVISDDVFEAHPTAVIGSARKQNMSHSPFNHQTKYMVNRGMTPRQLMGRELTRIYEAGLTTDVERFGRHGEDIGFVAQVLEAGLSTYSTPSIAYDVWSEDTNIFRSTLRTAHTAPALHQLEWDGLQQYPIKDYLKVTGTSILDGTYEWGDVDWRAYHKAHGTAAVIEPWDEAAELIRRLV